MNKKQITYPILIAIVVFLLLITPLMSWVETTASAQSPVPLDKDTTFVTVITVNSGTDPDDSKSKTCVTDTPCTLRRAIVQARKLGAAERPVLIEFNIPADPAEGYDSTYGIWKIHARATSDPSVFRTLEGGNITIDGSTQPGGSIRGPKIFVMGPSTGNKNGLVVGVNASGDHDYNKIKGLAFQNFKDHMTINSTHNIIEDNWFGLSDDGTEPFLRNDDPQDGSGSSGIAISAGAMRNTIQNNVFLGFDGVAAAIRGDENTFSDNYVGTKFNGKVSDKQTNPHLICSSDDWLGGGGISMEGDDHTVQGNIFAGLRQEIFSSSTQPDAIRVTGRDHLIRNNKIGLDSDNNKIGVCGRGVYLSDSPRGVEVTNNQIIYPELSAISLNGALYNENTLRSNIIKKVTEWPHVTGNPKGEDAIQVGPSLPDAFENFYPAKVTEINGTSVSGTSGDNSACPNCTIEIFLDNTDSITETRQSLAVVTAASDGTWSATIPFELTSSQGLRTTSTTTAYNTIPDMSAGTTTGLSVLYMNGSISGNKVYLPLVVR